MQSREQMNLGAGLGVVVQEFSTSTGPVDYALFVQRQLCGVVEAKAEGTTLSGFSEQAARYMGSVPDHLLRREGQVRFEYVASSTEILFRPCQPGTAVAPRLSFPSARNLAGLACRPGHDPRPAPDHAAAADRRAARPPGRRHNGA